MSTKSFFNNEEIENLIVIPPDGGWGWFVVFAAFISSFVIDGIGYTFGLYIDILSKEFETGVASTALFGSVMTATSFFVGPFVSALMNKYDFRCVAITGCILACGAYAICSFCSNQYVFLVCYGIMLGTGFGMMYVPAIVMPSLYFTKWRALATGISTTGSGFGTLVVPPLITPFLNNYGWRITFRLIIALVFVAGLLTLAYVPLTPYRAVHRKGKKDIYFGPGPKDEDEERTCRERCCSCCNYSNKYYPTTNEIIPAKEADLELDVDAQERRITTYYGDSSVISLARRKSIMQRSRFLSTVSTILSKRELCKYNCLVCVYSECFEHDSKPMYRDDIFYNYTIRLIPRKNAAYMMKKKIKTKEKEKQKQKLEKKLRDSKQREESAEFMKEYHMGVTRVTIYKEFLDRKKCRCHLSVIRPLVTLLHLDLFKSCAFILIAMSGLFYTFGFMIPLMYIVDRGQKNGIDKDVTIWFLATIGGFNTLGRLISGVLPCILPINVFILTACSTVICGVMTAVSGLSMEVWFQFLYGGCFGFFGASMTALKAIIIVELFGIENLTNVFGLQLLLSGIAAVFGPTVAGILYDKTNTYEYSFYLSGGCIILSGLILIIVTRVRRWELRHEQINVESPSGSN